MIVPATSVSFNVSAPLVMCGDDGASGAADNYGRAI
jgi:hypothetical protein